MDSLVIHMCIPEGTRQSWRGMLALDSIICFCSPVPSACFNFIDRNMIFDGPYLGKIKKLSYQRYFSHLTEKWNHKDVSSMDSKDFSGLETLLSHLVLPLAATVLPFTLLYTVGISSSHNYRSGGGGAGTASRQQVAHSG